MSSLPTRPSATSSILIEWRIHDLLMWDDRCTMHHGTDLDDLRWTRDMHRATVSDMANTCEQEGVAVTASPARPTARANEEA